MHTVLARVVVTIGSVTVTPPLMRAGTEPVAYWPVVVPIDGLADAKSLPDIGYSFFDASGKVVKTGKLTWLGGGVER